ncbi:MAG: LPXTG cell wall anchor domain-containing protein, partial [Acidimicrobiales bacterium]
SATTTRPALGAPAAGDAGSDAALGPRSTSQSAGAAGNPVLLFTGLGLVFGGGVFLAVRNRRRV